MSRYEHGRIIAVNEVRFGSNLNGDHAAGVTTLTVEDAADFDETGGQLTINGQVITYTGFDDDTGTIALAAPLAAAAEDGDRVDAWDPLYGGVSAEKIAQVQLDGEDDTNTDPIEATVALHLCASLDDGIRGTAGESVLIEQDGDEWRVIDVLGLSDNAGVKFEADDFHTLNVADVAAGSATIRLSHRPIDESIIAWWRRQPQEPSEYSVNYDTQTIAWPLAGFEKAGDRLWVHYAYHQGIADRKFGFEGDGWRYLVTAEADATNRSAPSFNDSTWSVGRGAFGNQIAGDGTAWPTQVLGWPAPNTVTSVNIGIWLRRPMPEIPAGADVRVQLRIDGDATVYWNGTLIATQSGFGTSEVPEIAVPPSALGGDNLLAIHLVDDIGDQQPDFIYIDAQVRW